MLRQNEFMQIYCNKFEKKPCYVLVAPTVAVDLRFTP